MLDARCSVLQAWNYLGAASELAGRGTQAVTAYRRALGLLEEQRNSFATCSSAPGTGEGGAWAEAVRVARANLGRALVLKGEAGEAVSYLGPGDLTEVLPCNFHSVLSSSTSISNV